MRCIIATLGLIVLLASGCSSGSSEEVTGTGADLTTPDEGGALIDDQPLPTLDVDVIGPSVALAETGAANSAKGPEEFQATADLPESFEVLVSLFDLDGRIAVGYSPFVSGDSTCLEGRLDTDKTVPKMAIAAVSPGVDCSSFSPFATPATMGRLLVCSDVLFLTTEWTTDVLESPGTSLLANVTVPLIPDGSNWIGGTISGPISPAEIPPVDVDGLECGTSPDLALSDDVPVLEDPVTQQLGIVERADGGLQVSFSSLGEGPSIRTSEYVRLATGWGEIVVDDGNRVEVRHADGRYVTFAASGGPGPMTFELCEWPSEPPDTACG